MNDAFPDYRTKLFIDSNVVLEAKELEQLPWAEVDPVGPILVLVTPQLLREVDSKKRDGRLGPRARAFNRRMQALVKDATVVPISEGPLRVDLALATCSRIDWSQHDDLDPQEGDHRLVLEVIHAKGVPLAQRKFASQDLNPLMVAKRHGVETVHLSENWLPIPEPSAKDREIAKLKSQVRGYQNSEPTFEIRLKTDSTPIPLIRVEVPSREEMTALSKKMVTWNPKPSQSGGLLAINFDNTLDDRYNTYVNETVPAFAYRFYEELEIMCGQVRFELEVASTGMVQAENAKIDIQVAGGFMHRCPIVVPSRGPFPPSVRHPMDYINRMPAIARIPGRVGKHEFDYDPPQRADGLSAACEDFRHGDHWNLKGVLALDPRADEHSVMVTITAANLRGKVQERLPLQVAIRDLQIDDLIDEEGKYKNEPRMLLEFRSAYSSDPEQALEDFEWTNREN